MAKAPTPAKPDNFRLVIVTPSHSIGIVYPTAEEVQGDLDDTRARGTVIQSFTVTKNGTDVTEDFH